jgi:WD40 repeat protein
VILVVALILVAMATAVILVGASRLLPDRLFSQNGFRAVGSVANPGSALPGTLTALPDGRALLTDGVNLDLFDPATGEFVRAKSHLSVPRQDQAATLLRDGTVLIVGGGAADRAVPASGGSAAELFDPATDTVTQLGPTLDPRPQALAISLQDGRALIAGGQDPSAQVGEIYDPATRSFRRTTSTTGGWGALNRVVQLDDGRVLIVGGRDTPEHGIDTAAEVFDPTTEQFSATGPMAILQRPWTATPLSDGRVLLLGGFGWDPVGQVASISDAVQIYDPSTGTFTLAGRMPTPRTGHAAVLLDDGDVLVTGGISESDWDTERIPQLNGGIGELVALPPVAVTDALRWDHDTGEFVSAGSMARWRSLFLATRLQDGQVLMIGHYPWHMAAEEPLTSPSEEELETVWSAEVFE